jgi:hypothetical protein
MTCPIPSRSVLIADPSWRVVSRDERDSRSWSQLRSAAVVRFGPRGCGARTLCVVRPRCTRVSVSYRLYGPIARSHRSLAVVAVAGYAATRPEPRVGRRRERGVDGRTGRLLQGDRLQTGGTRSRGVQGLCRRCSRCRHSRCGSRRRRRPPLRGARRVASRRRRDDSRRPPVSRDRSTRPPPAVKTPIGYPPVTPASPTGVRRPSPGLPPILDRTERPRRGRGPGRRPQTLGHLRRVDRTFVGRVGTLDNRRGERVEGWGPLRTNPFYARITAQYGIVTIRLPAGC